MNILECIQCKKGPCICNQFESPCLDTGNFSANWHETTCFEITEHKPDYQKMAEDGQFGKFWDDDNNVTYDYLVDYDSEYGRHFQTKEKHRFKDDSCEQDLFLNFTPCAEPVELDHITMEPKQ